MIPDPIGEAVALVRDGGLVAYPTETVWGLGADATSEVAVARLQRWKRRDPAAPLSLLVEAPADLAALDFDVSDTAARLVKRFWPGPLTLVLPCRRRFAAGVARSDGGVGVRCSSHPLVGAFARRLRAEGVGPISATSLNRTGDEAATDVGAARALCGEGIEEPQLLDVEGAEAGGTPESTVLDLTGERPRVLRWGACPEPELAPLLPAMEAP